MRGPLWNPMPVCTDRDGKHSTFTYVPARGQESHFADVLLKITKPGLGAKYSATKSPVCSSMPCFSPFRVY